MNVAAEWLRSGEAASLDGIDLVPRSYPEFASLPISIVRGQATAYVLEDRQNRGWILKKFLPGREPELAYIRAIRDLVPPEAGFASGSERRVLMSQHVGQGFDSPEFTDWIDKTILMPRVGGTDWLGLGEEIRAGAITAEEGTRVALCRNLVSCVRALERTGLSHRDLSITNVFIDPATWEVHLIDWDSLYHSSLTRPSNTMVGTPGYTAPFVMTAQGEDARRNWCPHADRYAMALLCVEFLMLDRGSDYTHEGGLFEQSDLYAGRGRTIRNVTASLSLRYPAIARLVDRTLNARTFATCPSPDEWLAAPPLAPPILPPYLDRERVMERFDWYIEKLNQQLPPPPPAPPLPDIDFSAVIRNLLNQQPLAGTPATPTGAEQPDDQEEDGDV